MNLEQAEIFLVELFLANSKLAVEMQSKPGVGKTSLVKQVRQICAERLEQPVGLRVFHLTTIDQPDVCGYMIPAKNKNGEHISVFTRSPILPGRNAPERGIIFLDERKQADNDVQKPCARLLEEHRLGDQKLPDGWVVWSASNRVSDRSGAHKDMAFIGNRLCRIQIEGHLDSWVRWAEIRGNVHPFLVAFAKKSPGIVFDTEVPVDESPFCTPRTLVKCQDILLHISDSSIATEAVCGLIGEGAGAELMAFMRVANELPDLEEILKDPKGTRVPEAPDAQLAVTQMCAQRMTARNAIRLFTYITRLPREFQIKSVHTAMRKVPTLMNNKEVSDWLSQNADLILSASGVV